MQKLTHIIDRVLEWTLILLMSVSVINVLWQVATRFILQNPSSVTEELARYLLIWVGVLGAGYGFGKKAHLAIDLLPMKLQGKNRVYLELAIQASIFLFALFVMVIGGIRLVSIVLYLDQTSAALQVKLAWVYLVLPITGVLVMYYAVVNAIEALHPPAEEGPERPGSQEPAAID